MLKYEAKKDYKNKIAIFKNNIQMTKYVFDQVIFNNVTFPTYILVCKNGTYAMLNMNFEYITPYLFNRKCSVDQKDYALLHNKLYNKWYVYNKDGAEVLDTNMNDIHCIKSYTNSGLTINNTKIVFRKLKPIKTFDALPINSHLLKTEIIINKIDSLEIVDKILQ